VNYGSTDRIDGKYVYDLVISMIGKKHPRLKDLDHVPDIDLVKAHISAFFKEHPALMAKSPAREIYFMPRGEVYYQGPTGWGP
jgi:hypothetical protein